MSKGESGHLHTAKNCRKFISGTLGKKKKKRQTKLWTGFFSKWSFKLLFFQPKTSAPSPKPPSPSKKPIPLLVLHTFPWKRWHRQFLKQFTYEKGNSFPSADSIDTYLTKTLAWNKLVWTVYMFNPILSKVVPANREKCTTTTTTSHQVACAPTPISAGGQQELASGNLSNYFHICTHSKATLKYHNQT